MTLKQNGIITLNNWFMDLFLIRIMDTPGTNMAGHASRCALVLCGLCNRCEATLVLWAEGTGVVLQAAQRQLVYFMGVQVSPWQKQQQLVYFWLGFHLETLVRRGWTWRGRSETSESTKVSTTKPSCAQGEIAVAP